MPNLGLVDFLSFLFLLSDSSTVMYCDNIHTAYRRIVLIDILSLTGAKYHHECSVLDAGVFYCCCELNNNASVISCHTGPLRP